MTALTSQIQTWKTRPRLVHERDADPLAVLTKLGRAIGSCRDVDALMRAVARQLANAFDADRACLYVHDEAGFELWTRIDNEDDASPCEVRFPADHGLCGRVFATHRPMCIVDAFDDPRFIREVAARNGCQSHSMLIVPIQQAANRCLGVLQVMDRRIGRFTEEDLSLLEAVAEFVAVVLENLSIRLAHHRQFNTLVAAVSAALDARDILTATHSKNVANYACGIGTILGLTSGDIERLHIAGLLHDVGKVGVPETILTKPGRLTHEDFEELKQHARYTKDILSRVQFADELRGVDFIAAAHHERLDGSGYPDMLTADQLPLTARIMAVADIFDALTQTRHYRPAKSTHEALAELDAMTPRHLDRTCVAALKAFLRCGPWPAH